MLFRLEYNLLTTWTSFNFIVYGKVVAVHVGGGWENDDCIHALENDNWFKNSVYNGSTFTI